MKNHIKYAEIFFPFLLYINKVEACLFKVVEVEVMNCHSLNLEFQKTALAGNLWLEKTFFKSIQIQLG